MNTHTPSSVDDDPWPPTLIGWYVVAVLALANAVSFIDRLILSLLIPQIKADLLLSDTQISLLQGIAFAVFYGVMGLPIARVADSKSRKYIIMIGISFWSFATALCGLGRNFWQLFLARVGVGVGEASLSPSAYSMLADYFHPSKLALPIGVFTAGVTAGMGLSLILGAAAIQFVSTLGTLDIPLLGPLSDWRLVFVFVGVLGVIPVALMATIKEPKRRGIARSASGEPISTSIPLAEVGAYVKKNWVIYLLVFTGYGTTSIAIYGILTWTPVFYMRSFGMSASDAGYLMGVVAAVGGISGAFFGGAWSDWLERRGDDNAKLRVLLTSCLFLWPAGTLSPLMPNVWFALALLFFVFFFGTACSGPAGSFVQTITPNRMRAQAGAAYQLALNLVGLGLGPTMVALFTDYVFQDEMMVRYSISWVVGVTYPFAIFFSWLAFRHFPKVRTQLLPAQPKTA